MTTADRVKYLREKLGLTQEELARKMGLKDRSSVAKIEKMGGEISLYRIEMLAKALDTTIPYLMGFDENLPSNTVKIPVLGQVAAGRPIVAEENIIGYEELPLSMAQSGNYFALKIKGNSMRPKIEDGDVVIVEQTECAENDEIVIALVENNEFAVCKKFKVFENNVALISINPEYEPLYFSKDNPCKIIGKVIQLRRAL